MKKITLIIATLFIFILTGCDSRADEQKIMDKTKKEWQEAHKNVMSMEDKFKNIVINADNIPKEKLKNEEKKLEVLANQIDKEIKLRNQKEKEYFKAKEQYEKIVLGKEDSKIKLKNDFEDAKKIEEKAYIEYQNANDLKNNYLKDNGYFSEKERKARDIEQKYNSIKINLKSNEEYLSYQKKRLLEQEKKKLEFEEKDNKYRLGLTENEIIRVKKSIEKYKADNIKLKKKIIPFEKEFENITNVRNEYNKKLEMKKKEIDDLYEKYEKLRAKTNEIDNLLFEKQQQELKKRQEEKKLILGL